MGDQGRCRVGRSRAGLGRHRRQLQPNTGLPPRLRRAGGAADPAVPCKGLPPPPRAPPAGSSPGVAVGAGSRALLSFIRALEARQESQSSGGGLRINETS